MFQREFQAHEVLQVCFSIFFKFVFSASGLQVHRDSDVNNAKTPFKFNEESLKKIQAVIANYPEGHKVKFLLKFMEKHEF